MVFLKSKNRLLRVLFATGGLTNRADVRYMRLRLKVNVLLRNTLHR